MNDRSFALLEQQLKEHFDAYPLDVEIFRFPDSANDEQLPFLPNHLWSITSPSVLANISLISPEVAIENNRDLYATYGLDQLRAVSSVEKENLVPAFLQLECRLGLRICLAMCEVDDRLVGFRIVGQSHQLEDLVMSFLE